MGLSAWIQYARPWSFVMTVMSVGLGGVLAFVRGWLDPLLLTLTLIGLVAFHAATNMANDYFDVKHRVDTTEAPTARYRQHPLLGVGISPSTFTLVVAGLYIFVLSVATFIAIFRGPIVMLFTAAGLFFSYFYTARPLMLKYRALGEPSVILIWGPLMTGGTYYVLTGQIDIGVMAASLPLGILVGLVLFANNIRDIEYDRSAGIKTLAIMLGQERSIKLYIAMIASTYVITALLVVGRFLTPLTFLTLLTLPRAIRLIKIFRHTVPDTADPVTAQLTMKFGITMIAGILIGSLIGI